MTCYSCDRTHMDEIIQCDAEVATLLVQLRRALWRSSQPARLDSRVVEDAIEKLGPLPSELLAYCAAIGSMAMLLSENDELVAFYTANEQAGWDRELGDFLAFDSWGDWPRSYAMYAPSERAFGIFALKTTTLQRMPTLAAMVATRLDSPTAPTAEELATFQPSIHRVQLAARRVVHAKFGTGTVLAAREGKLEIDFGEHGIKLLAERFVKDDR
jgi:hypothetical protein